MCEEKKQLSLKYIFIFLRHHQEIIDPIDLNHVIFYFIIKIEDLMKVRIAVFRLAFIFSRREKLNKPVGIRVSHPRTFLNTHKYHRVDCIPVNLDTFN